jgi:hypothetical protein
MSLVKVSVRDLAHARAGDKGDTSMVAVVARQPEYFPFLRDELTTEKVAAFYGDLVKGDVTRFVLPKLFALNFVMTSTLGGGVTRSLRLDPHGKTRAYYLLAMNIEVPEDLIFRNAS